MDRNSKRAFLSILFYLIQASVSSFIRNNNSADSSPAAYRNQNAKSRYEASTSSRGNEDRFDCSYMRVAPVFLISYTIRMRTSSGRGGIETIHHEGDGGLCPEIAKPVSLTFDLNVQLQNYML